VFVRINTSQVSETMAFLKDAWAEVNPDKPFIHYFQDDALASLYRSEKRWGQIIRYSCVFSILLACLGIFGLTSMSLSRRAKEIGVRKVLGARAEQIVLTTIRDYISLIALANALAWPAAYLILRRVLQAYPYRISVGPAYFLLTGAASLLVTVLTVLYLSIRSALADPADVLRYE
jgi:putative ABC transport system permease protein